MHKKTLWHLAGGITIAITLILGLFALTGTKNVPVETPDSQIPQTTTVFVTVEGVMTRTPVLISAEDTVLDALYALDEEDERLRLKTTEYSGLGTLVESMNGKNNGTNNEYWQYTVNGTMPQVGADQLKLNPGDLVEWNFDKSEF